MQCFNVRFGHTTMSGVLENPMEGTKITNICFYSADNDINLLFDLVQMAAILDFAAIFLSKNEKKVVNFI